MDVEEQESKMEESTTPPEKPAANPLLITANRKDKDGVVRTVSVEYDFGDNLDDAVAEFGETLVFAKFKASAKIDAQSQIARDILAGKTEAEIREHFLTWKPGMPVERKAKDPVEQLIGKWKDMDEGQRAEMLKRLKAAE